jgi:hypothetical protein
MLVADRATLDEHFVRKFDAFGVSSSSRCVTEHGVIVWRDFGSHEILQTTLPLLDDLLQSVNFDSDFLGNLGRLFRDCRLERYDVFQGLRFALLIVLF